MGCIEKRAVSTSSSSLRSNPSRAASRCAASYFRYAFDLEDSLDLYDNPKDADYDEDVGDVEENGYAEDTEDVDNIEDVFDASEDADTNSDADDAEDMVDAEDTDHIDVESVQPKTPQSPVSELNSSDHGPKLLQRLNSLIESKSLSIVPRDGRIELDDDMLPVVQVQRITVPELLQIQRHLEKYPALSPSWVEFLEFVRIQLGRAQTDEATWTYAHFRHRAQTAHRRTWDSIIELVESSDILNRIDMAARAILKELIEAVCFLCGIRVDEKSTWKRDLAEKLFEQDIHCYTHVDRIVREFQLCHKRATPEQDQKSQIKIEEAVRCLLKHPTMMQQECILNTAVFRALGEKSGGWDSGVEEQLSDIAMDEPQSPPSSPSRF